MEIVTVKEYFKKMDTFTSIEEVNQYPLLYHSNIIPVKEIERILYDSSKKFIDFAKTNGKVFTTIIIGAYLFIITMKDVEHKLLTIQPFIFVKSTKTFYHMHYICTISTTFKTNTMYSAHMDIKLSDMDEFLRNMENNNQYITFTTHLPSSAVIMKELQYEIYRA